MASINDTISGWRPQVVYPKYGIASGEYNRYFYSLKDVNLNNDPCSFGWTFPTAFFGLSRC